MFVIREGLYAHPVVVEGTLESQLQRTSLPTRFCENIKFIGFYGVQQKHKAKYSEYLDII